MLKRAGCSLEEYGRRGIQTFFYRAFGEARMRGVLVHVILVDQELPLVRAEEFEPGDLSDASDVLVPEELPEQARFLFLDDL